MRVAFKRFEDGDIIAIFPDQRWSKDCTDMLTSYMTLGQHAPCSDSLLRELDDATEEEYIGLKEEIEHIYKERVNVYKLFK